MADGQKQNGTGFSLSFGGGKAAHRNKRIRVNEEEAKAEQQFVTGFAENGAVLQNGDQKTVIIEGATKRVIPTQGNDFRGMGPRAYNPKRYAIILACSLDRAVLFIHHLYCCSSLTFLCLNLSSNSQTVRLCHLQAEEDIVTQSFLGQICKRQSCPEESI